MPNPEASFASTESAENRQPRQARLVKAALVCPRLGRFDVTIRNVSETGIGGRAPHGLTIGEKMTIFLPGHEPMLGTVRWVVDKSFGIETDRPVDIQRLRASHGDDLRPSDSSIEFQIVPAPKADTWRPGLTRGTKLPGHFGRKR